MVNHGKERDLPVSQNAEEMIQNLCDWSGCNKMYDSVLTVCHRELRCLPPFQ